MLSGESWDLRHVSDDELLRVLVGLVSNERRALALMLAHLVEVDGRRLHLKIGCSSLFDYCLRRLGLSEGEAFRRVTGARLARRFPMVLELLAKGDLHLTALCMLRDFVTPDNHHELFKLASHQTKRQLEELLARRAPRGDVPSLLRKLPAPRQSTTETMVLETPAECPPASPTAHENERREIAPSPAPARPAPSNQVPAPLTPLREDRYRVQLTANESLKQKLELARDLMSHSNASGDLAVVVERALDLLIDKIQREHLARTKTIRPSAEPHPGSRHIPNATRRQVVERDGLRCTYVAPDGQRCESRRFLQFHHDHAWAKGGGADASNIRVLCSAHNRLLAEKDFGKENVARAIAASRPGSTR
jgi:5-methylcytosine-specific restriction endonuclease McrA